MKKAVFPLVLIFGSFPLFAQNARAQSVRNAGLQVQSGAVSAPQATALRAQFSSGCPVAMRLNQRISGGLRETGKGQQKVAFLANLHLELANATSSRAIAANVKAAAVTVHGYDGTPHFELVNPGQTGLTARSMEIRFVPQVGNGAAADFSVNGIASASWLEVNSLTFANGTIWKPARGESCTVSPNPFKLVGADSGAGRSKP